MAEDISDTAEVWLWAVEYLASLEHFDRSLLEELIESIPGDVRKSAKDMLQSQLPAKSTLELLKEKILGGFISDEYLKRWSGVVSDSVQSDSVRPMGSSGVQVNQRSSNDEVDYHSLGSDSIDDDSSSDDDDDSDVVLVEASGAKADGVEVQNDLQQPSTVEASGATHDERVMESSGVRINQRPSTDETDHQSLASESIEDDSSSDEGDDVDLVETSGANAGVEVRNNLQQPSTVEASGATRDARVSLEEVRDDHDYSTHVGGSSARADDIVDSDSSDDYSDDDVDLVETSDANDLQQPSTVEASGATRDEIVRLEGVGDDQDYSAHVEGPSARADDGVHNGKQPSGALVEKVNTGGNKPIEVNQNGSISLKNAHSNDVQNSKKLSDAVVEHNPSVNNDGKLNEQMKSGRNKPIETSHRGPSTSVEKSDVQAKVDCSLKNGDKNLEQIKSVGKKLIEKNQHGSIASRSSNSAQSNGDVQNHQEPTRAAVVEHPLVSGDGNPKKQLKLDGMKEIGNNHGVSASMNTSDNSKQPSDAGIDLLLKNGGKNCEKVKSGGNKPIEQNFNDSISMKSSNDVDVQNPNHQQLPGAMVEHQPLVNGNGNPTNKQVKSDGNKPIETTFLVGSTSVKTHADNNQVQNHQQSSSVMETENELENVRVHRKRKVNDFLENHQLQPLSGFAGPTDLCVKCHQTGAMLVCATAGCPMMLHKSCLGFDVEERGGEGSFCCPLCSYSRAVAEFREAQKRVALTRKDLTTFVIGMQL